MIIKPAIGGAVAVNSKLNDIAFLTNLSKDLAQGQKTPVIGEAIGDIDIKDNHIDACIRQDVTVLADNIFVCGKIISQLGLSPMVGDALGNPLRVLGIIRKDF